MRLHYHVMALPNRLLIGSPRPIKPLLCRNFCVNLSIVQTLLIIYDIAHPKRLRLVEKVVSNFAIRLQDSIFKAELDEEQLTACQLELSSVIEPSEDSVRYYPLCAADVAACISFAPATPECGAGWLI